MQQLDVTTLKWWTPPVVLVAALLLGIALGAATNLINVTISPAYFRMVINVMWYLGPLGVRGFAVRQGMLEGGMLGCFLGILMSISLAASTRLRCPARFALKYLMLAMAIVLACWVAGGIAGMLLMWQIPELWGTVFFGVPPDANPTAFGWVGGTIYGAYAGTPIGLLVCSVALHRRWKKLVRTDWQGFPVQRVDTPI